MTASDRPDARTVSGCLIHTGAVGDLILALPIVASLRDHLRRIRPDSTVEIEVLGHAARASVAVGRAGVDAVTSLEHLPMHTMFAETGPADPSCSAYFARFELIANMAASEDATFTRRLREIAPGLVITIDPMPRSATRHVTEGWFDDLRAAGISPSSEPPRIVFADDERRRARRRLWDIANEDDAPIVLLHPGSGGRGKCWPVEQFAGLAEAVRQDGLQPIFMLGPVESDLHGEALVTQLDVVAPVLVESDLVQAAAAIAAADAHVGNDAGMTHVAAAVGTPTTAIFGSTDPVVWRPLGDHVTVIFGRPTGTFDGITVASVRRAIVASVGV